MTPSNRALWKPLWARAIGSLLQLNGSSNPLSHLLQSRTPHAKARHGPAGCWQVYPPWQSLHLSPRLLHSILPESALVFLPEVCLRFARLSSYRLRISPETPP